jgi:hypothetical protein
LYITNPKLSITRRRPSQTVQSDRAGPGPGYYKTPPRCQGLGFSGGGGSFGRASGGDPGVSGGAAPRRANDDGAPLGTNDGDAPKVGGQAVMMLSKRTGGGDAP